MTDARGGEGMRALKGLGWQDDEYSATNPRTISQTQDKIANPALFVSDATTPKTTQIYSPDVGPIIPTINNLIFTVIGILVAYFYFTRE